MNRNKLLTRQVAGNGILSYSFPKPSDKPSLAALTIISVALVVAFYGLLIIQYLYQL